MKPKLLDLFCGAGGASMGYYRAGFEVEGVDIKPQPHYPFKFYQADALTFPLEGYDAYHASPPCQAYTSANAAARKRGTVSHPDLVGITRDVLIKVGKPYIIENVVGSPLNTVVILDGRMFGLKVRRARLFETSFLLLQPGFVKEAGQICGIDFFRPMTRGCWIDKRKGERKGSLEEWAEAMGIDWSDEYGLTQAIPPAYTEYIGKYLLGAMR